MGRDIAEQLVEKFERGLLSRRQLDSRLMGLGATLAVIRNAQAGQSEGETEKSTFQATGIDHVALDETNVPRSRDFYVKHLGLRVVTDGGEDNCFLGPGSGGHFFLTLFRGDTPGLNHYCYKIEGFDPEKAGEKLKAAGLKPELVERRVSNRRSRTVATGPAIGQTREIPALRSLPARITRIRRRRRRDLEG